MDNEVIVSKVVKSITTEKENLHESVPIGQVRLIEVIAYFEDKPAKTCFCETGEQRRIFRANNPTATKIESFTIALLRMTALKYLNDPDNRKEFIER